MTQKRRQKDAKEYSVIVLELDDAEPRRISSHPNLLILKTTQTPEERFTQLRQGKSKNHKWGHNRIVKLRPDLMPEATFSTGKKAEEEMDRLKKNLKEQGFTVGQDQRIWQVSVIELKKEDGPEKWVYVGSTSQTKEERFRDHIEGRRNKRGRVYSPTVHKYGVKLRPHLEPEKNIFLTKEEGEVAEKRHAKNLEAAGFKVKQG